MLSKQLGVEYDLVIRARIDTVLDEKFEIVENNMLNVPMGWMSCPTFRNSDGLNDCFAYGRPKIMDYYAFIFLQMMEYINAGNYAFPPEHFLGVHFNKINLQIFINQLKLSYNENINLETINIFIKLYKYNESNYR